MFSFFTPVAKIQKDRHVLRETDERMAKYSRRGLMSNFVIFLLCMAVGSLLDEQPTIAIALSIGLLITTLLRGYLLFRFEALYPRAPTLWRTRYFYATLLGASWWGLIIAVETLIVGINNEAPLLWLYTIVFFSMTANAFAPYKKFLTIYQGLGLVPGAFCLLFVGDMTGIIYGIVVFFFIWLLHHQCEQTADNYWERLESTAALARKTESLEEEKRDTRATAQLHRDYMLLLKKELHQLLNAKRGNRADDTPTANEEPNSRNEPSKKETHPLSPSPMRRPKLQQLYTNVSDFYQILTKEIEFQERPFNPRALLQHIITEYASDAAEKNIDIELALSPGLPHHIQGDSERLSQIIDSVINSVVSQLEGGALFIDVEYIQERGKVGELHILASHQSNAQRTLFNSGHPIAVSLNLELALAIGLAEAQSGSLDITSNNQGTQIRYRAKYPNHAVVESQEPPVSSFKNKRLLLVHENPRVIDAKRQELSNLGFNVTTETQLKRALAVLRENIKSNKPFAAVVFHSHADPKATADFSQALAEESSCKLIPQIIMGATQARNHEAFTHVITNPYVHWLNKPVIQNDFKRCFSSLFNSDELLRNVGTSAIMCAEMDQDLAAELTEGGVTWEHFSETKNLMNATEKTHFYNFVFIDAPLTLSQIYPELRKKHPNCFIVALGSQADGHTHLQQGADVFLAQETPHASVALYLKTIEA